MKDVVIFIEANLLINSNIFRIKIKKIDPFNQCNI